MAKRKITPEECRTLDESGLRDAELPSPKTEEELLAQLSALVDREHDYGTCVYAMSLGALAAFHYVAHKLGVTGFQASCADMDFIARTRNWEHGGRVLDYGDLLYPQYEEKFDGLGFWALIRENITDLAKAAREKLAKHQGAPPEESFAHPNVMAHWEAIVALDDAVKEDAKFPGREG